MTIERSKGKARPTRPRSKTLKASDTARVQNRDERGRLTKGNTNAQGRGWKRAIRRSLGADATEGAVAIVASDARKVFVAALKVMPSDAAPVRSLLVLHARHLSLHGFLTSRAEVVGLDCPEGLKLLDVASRESQRAERTLVTALDVARVCAENEKRNAVPTWPWSAPPAPAPSKDLSGAGVDADEDDADSSGSSPDASPPDQSSPGGEADGLPADEGEPDRGDDDEPWRPQSFDTPGGSVVEVRPGPDVDAHLDAAARAYRQSLRSQGFPVPTEGRNRR